MMMMIIIYHISAHNRWRQSPREVSQTLRLLHRIEMDSKSPSLHMRSVGLPTVTPRSMNKVRNRQKTDVVPTVARQQRGGLTKL